MLFRLLALTAGIVSALCNARASDKIEGQILLIDAHVDDVVPGHTGVTYKALLKQFLTDLALDKEEQVWRASAVSGVRRIDGSPRPYPASGVSFQTLNALAIRSDGKPVLVIALFEFPVYGPRRAKLVAAYDMTVQIPALLDFVWTDEVDWETGLGTALPISADTDAFIVFGDANNANDSSQTVAYAFVHRGRITPIAGARAYRKYSCTWRTRQTVAVDRTPDPDAPYMALTVTHTQETTPRTDLGSDMVRTCAKDTEPYAPPGVQTFTDIYRWDAAKGAYASATKNCREALQMPEIGMIATCPP